MDVECCPWLSGDKEGGRTVVVGNQLTRYLGPEYVSYRRGEGGRMLAYMEGHEVINLMNTIFGWDGWNSKVVSFVTDYADVSNGGKWNVGVAATVRLTAVVKGSGERREVWHEDTGYGTVDNGPSRGKAMEKCRKEAVTDGLKRAARQFGNATGGCLYNKEYLERVKKVKGPVARIEFVEEDLFRKPMNKRKRFMMAQERVRSVEGSGGDDKDGFFGDEDDDDDDEMLAGMRLSDCRVEALIDIQVPTQTNPSTSLSNAACLIRNHLPTELESARTDGLLTPNHECFTGAQRFCDRWSISLDALRNFIKLACGTLRFPTILLWNPADVHDKPSFSQMIRLTPTLSWLKELLGEIGLKMAEVIILDVCPLLSEKYLCQLEPGRKKTAIEEAYSVTQEILAAIKPKIVISCQCQTKGSRTWPVASNQLAFNLCSSVSGARNGLVATVRVEDHDIHVIQGFHPMYLLRNHLENITEETILKGLFRMVYTPCATWRREVET